MEVPLIFTSKGNLPIGSLRYEHKREDVPGEIVFIEEYFLGDESVKRSVHVLPVVGICLQGVDLSYNVTVGLSGVKSDGVAATIS